MCVPEEVVILICHKNPRIGDSAQVRPSGVDDDIGRIGQEGAKLLDQIIDGKPSPKAPTLTLLKRPIDECKIQ